MQAVSRALLLTLLTGFAKARLLAVEEGSSVSWWPSSDTHGTSEFGCLALNSREAGLIINDNHA